MFDNNITRLCRESRDAKSFAEGYLRYLVALLQELDNEDIASFISEFEQSRLAGNTVFVVGNGGSATTASHMANDIALGIMKNGRTVTPFRVLSLTDNIPLITAISNDRGYENIFVSQLNFLYNPNDKLVVISATGNSPNIVAAARWVKKRGGRVIGLLGFDGGVLKDLCDVVLLARTPKGEYGPVEDIHMIMNHLVSIYLQHKATDDVIEIGGE